MSKYQIVPAPWEGTFRVMENERITCQGSLRDCEEWKERHDLSDKHTLCESCGHPMFNHFEPTGTRLMKFVAGTSKNYQREACDWSSGCYGGWCDCKGYKGELIS